MMQLKPCIDIVDTSYLVFMCIVYRGVNIELSCQYPWNVSMPKLKEAATEGHQTRTVQLETAVLMGMHSR